MTQPITQTDPQNSIKNIAFIDGQNLHLGTAEEGWRIDYEKFRVYLREMYKVKSAYYFLGWVTNEQEYLYEQLQEAGFIVVFREHKENFKGKKKGNVDTDIVFEMMRSLIEKDFDEIVLVSGDGDYKKTVDYLIKKEKFAKILFPNEKYSSLYKQLTQKYFDCLKNVKHKIEYIKKKEP